MLYIVTLRIRLLVFPAGVKLCTLHLVRQYAGAMARQVGQAKGDDVVPGQLSSRIHCRSPLGWGAGIWGAEGRFRRACVVGAGFYSLEHRGCTRHRGDDGVIEGGVRSIADAAGADRAQGTTEGEFSSAASKSESPMLSTCS